MRAKDGSAKQGRSFTEERRRAQIVDAAVETIAELGYARTSFGQIAKRAGLSSTGMISYHFASKDDLMNQVASDIHAVAMDVVGGPVTRAAGPREQLRAFIESSVEFYVVHHRHMRALTEIALSRREEAEPDVLPHEAELRGLEEIFREGQEKGEFREFTPRVMAVALRHALDGVALRIGTESEPDAATYAREVVTIFDLATREVDRTTREDNR